MASPKVEPVKMKKIHREVAPQERKLSARLAKKRKVKALEEVKQDDYVKNGLNSNGSELNNTDNQHKSGVVEANREMNHMSATAGLGKRIKDGSNSRSFLDCLELKPVKLTANEGNNLTRKDEFVKLKHSGRTISGKSKIQKKSGILSTSAFVSKKHEKNAKSLKPHPKSQTKKLDNSIINAETVVNNIIPISVESQSNGSDSIVTTETPDSKMKEARCDNQVDIDTENETENEHSSEQKHLKVIEQSEKNKSPVYIFRDVNKVAVNCSGFGEDDTVSVDFLGAVDLNRHGKKRRYDKLMKKLVDGERKLENNFKEVQQDDTDKEDITLCVEKMKEKLRVREKKKYEYLINYMRNQWQVDQKSFQDLLPQKVDVVQANVVKQLGANSEKVVTEKRMRGRPRKNILPDEKSKDLVKSKKPPSNGMKKSGTHKKKSNAAIRGFPVKFPKSLLSDTSVNFNHQKCENFRVGIVDKNGSQEIIELNSDTLKGKGSGRNEEGSSNSLCATEKTQVSVSKISLTVVGNVGSVNNGDPKSTSHCFEESTSNKTEENVALSASQRKDETISGAQGKNGLEDCASIGESPLDAWQKCPPTTITLPSIQSLEKEYELVSLSSSCPPETGDFETDQFFIPQSTFDKDGKTSMIIVGPFCVVCDPKPRLLLVSPEKRKKGPTMILRKKIHSPSSTPPRDFRIKKDNRWVQLPEKGYNGAKNCPADPAIILLDHCYMTPPELRDSVKRYSKAVAKHSANAKFINARVEDITQGEDNYVVTIKGANVLQQVKHMSSPLQAPVHCNEEGMPVVYSLSQVMTSSLLKAQEIAEREKLILESQQTGDYTHIVYPLSLMGGVVMEVLIPPGGTEVVPRTRSSKNYLYTEDLNLQRDLLPDSPAVGSEAVDRSTSNQPVRFLHSNTPITVSSDAKDCALSATDEEVTQVIAEKSEKEHVVIENEADVDAGPRTGLPCCRMCLRLFPSDYVLFTHVRSNHPACEIKDSVYLEELRARSRLACPVCCNPPVYLATPPKLRRHLRLHHGIEDYVAVCKICRMEFSDKQELDLHMELSHNTFSSRGLVSLLKRQQTGHFARGQRSLLTDCLSCNRCNIDFSDRASLLSHTLKVHPELNQFNICRLCDRVFDSGVALHKHLKKAHEQTHSGALKCPFCPAWLPNMELASVHRVTLHNGAVPVHCPFCGAGYQSLHPMYSHVKNQHLQTEAHICPECQSSFPTSRMLSEHVRKAHLMTPYVMKESIHNSNTTTYCCPFCTVSFIRTYDLAVHVVNAHKDHLLPAQCHMCMQSFVSEVVMKIHMSGAHGIDIRQQDGADEENYGHYDEGESVTVVLEDMGDEAIYSHSKGIDSSMHGSSLIRRHMLDAQDMLESQEANHYIQDLDEQDTETVVYLNERNQVVNTGEMFGACSSMEDVQLLGEASDDFNLHGVDYLETLTNDSIAVGADVVADVSMEDIANGRAVERSQSTNHPDLLGMTNQFEIDGVLYELAAPHDAPPHRMHGASDMVTIDSSDLRVAGDRITIDTSDLAHLLRQQVQ